jgi:hypothetical protein
MLLILILLLILGHLQQDYDQDHEQEQETNKCGLTNSRLNRSREDWTRNSAGRNDLREGRCHD